MGNGSSSQTPPPSFAPRTPGQSQRRPTSNTSSGGPTGTRVMPTSEPSLQGGRQYPPAGPGQRPPRPPGNPPTGGSAPATPPPRKRRRGRKRWIVALLVLALVAWPVGLLVWGNGKLQHVDALSDTADTQGTTYLLVGSDSREDGYFEGDPTEGQRADTMMLLTVPPSGQSSMISLPRDTYVEIPGYAPNKINAAYALGGPELLVETVENLAGQKVDHYIEIGMGGVANIVDAIGGVELCMDLTVNDPDSQLDWVAGCHLADGDTALAFARMRKSDPMGDIGRALRQQQVIQAVTSNAISPRLLNPLNQVSTADAALSAFTTDPETGVIDLGRLALAFRSVTGDGGVRGTPPIADYNYRPGSIGSAVLLSDNYREVFASAQDGTITQDMLDQ